MSFETLRIRKEIGLQYFIIFIISQDFSIDEAARHLKRPLFTPWMMGKD